MSCVTRIVGSALMFALALAAAGPARAALILVDFHDRVGTPAGWNLVTAADNGTTIDLLENDGVTDSGFDLTLPTNLNESGNPGWNPALPLPPSLLPAADDYMWFSFSAGLSVSFVFSNLDPTMTYNIQLLASRNLNRSQDFSVTSGADVDNWNTQTDGWNSGGLVTWTGLVPDASNEIVLTIARDGNSGSFNALSFESVPEPGPALLACLGLLGLAVLGRPGRRD